MILRRFVKRLYVFLNPLTYILKIMNCPNCQKPPMSFRQFAMRLVPVKAICQHCETKLQGDFFIKTAYYGALIFAVLFGLRIMNLKEMLGWDYSTVVLAVVGFVVGTVLIIGGFAWKFGNYQKDDG